MSDSTLQRPMSALAAILQKPEILGAWFNDKEIRLDGYRFVQCRFDNCRLYVSSANFELDKCFIDDKTLFYYQGDILKIVKLWNSRNLWMRENFPGFAPTRNSDGTITIL